MSAQLRLRLQPVVQRMAITLAALFVKLVGCDPDSLFQSVEAGIELAKECFPFLKGLRPGQVPFRCLLRHDAGQLHSLIQLHRYCCLASKSCRCDNQRVDHKT